MRRVPYAVVLGVCAVSLLGAGWWLGRRDVAPSPAPGSVPSTRAGDASDAIVVDAQSGDARAPETRSARSATQTAAIAPAVPAPLPAADAPLAQVFDELLERARAGDAGAACRLASDLSRCRFANGMRRGMDRDEFDRRIAREDDEARRDSMIDFIARMEEERERVDAICTGITSAQIELAFPLQQQAAQARPELRVWAALQPALNQRLFAGELDSWQQYRQTALPWLEAAAAEGDLSAVIALARVHGDERSFGPPVPPFRVIDDGRFLTYALLMERYGMQVPAVQRAAAEARARMDPRLVEHAESRAAQLFRPERQVTDENRGAAQAAMQRSFNPAPQPADCD
jgi:hypothetical protein